MQGIDTPLSTAEAVKLTGEKSVTQFLRVMKREGIAPVKELPGIRGAKFWDPADIAKLTPSSSAPHAADEGVLSSVGNPNARSRLSGVHSPATGRGQESSSPSHD